MFSPPSPQLPEGPLLTDHLAHWAAHRPHQRAFTYVEFPEPSSPGLHHTLGWQGLDVRARATAARIAAVAGPGERAALLLPQGLDYTAAFLGCLYAGVIAVPLFSPELPGHEGRLAAVLADCEPACVLADAGTAAGVGRFMAEQGLPSVPVVPVDRASVERPGVERPGATPAIALPERIEPDDIAYLQYTSGSTRSPAGVVISHANVVANARQAIEAFAADAASSTTVGWLPLFHDMGLVLSVAAPVVGGFPSALMDPVAFLEHPVRWLRLLAAYPGTISAAPNFAYDYCASRIDREEAAELRLDRVKVLINGSEPVRPGTVDRFRDAFADAGLAPAAHCPAYGLAEATVFVTTDTFAEPPTVLACDPLALSEGRLDVRELTTPEATHLVACGTPAGQELRIADPATGAALDPGEVGEIQLRGPNIGLCYWKRNGLSEEVFGFRPPDATGHDGEAGWLRTGDLGALHEGLLYITGRLKDLIIVDGRNHYPQDIEETVQSAVDLVRRDRLAAFRVPWTGTESDVLVVVAEHRRGARPTEQDLLAALRTATAAVSARHGLRLAELLLVPPGSLPRTSSGKVARAAGRARYLLGAFGEGGRGGAEGTR
ncbi:fatty acyl-AMP ligase [Streptomyces durmitorensis]|uniref:Fatty acyl-AMP ligase n=1 Tax=Streptomyces durmitorensis TaxID=319947 RepID=A0ABY4Q669_9ACTN|nr:fatty acyl-AMP ligase [Streptomyces durmitorensis]UQT60523.1 fatty acyl-AMP ligase [Streptomyces durmitorensis]